MRSQEWVTHLTEEPNWRAFMSKLPSTEEANWRDAMSEARVGTAMEMGFLSEDGSMAESSFNGSKLDEIELIMPPEVESTITDSNVRFVSIPKEQFILKF